MNCVHSKAFLFAAGIVASAFVAPSYGVQILLDGEGDSGTVATDKLAGDGLQNPTDFFYSASVDNTPGNAAFGTSAFKFEQVNVNDGTKPSRFTMTGTAELGSSFTLAAQVKSTNASLMSVFSSWEGGGGWAANLAFQVNHDTARLRLLIDDQYLQTSTWGSVSDGTYHHVAMTFNSGIVAFYRDGVLLETADISAALTSFTGNKDLWVGNNFANGSQQFVGWMDDILVLDRALTGAEILDVKNRGAVAVLVPEPSAVFGALLLAGMLIPGRKRARA